MLARSSMDRDAAHWEAVDEAAELMHEERFHEALRVLHTVVKADPTNPYAFFFMGQAIRGATNNGVPNFPTLLRVDHSGH